MLRWPRAQPLVFFLAAFLLWLLNHPRFSIDYHDAIIYAILGLHRLNPQAYARDPFFMFGSQDSFSLFSVLYAPLIEHFGLSVAAVTVLLLGGLLWCAASVALSQGLMRNVWPAGMAVILTAVLSISYSPNGATFVLNEGFATARSIAFPLGILAMAACLSERRTIAGLCGLAAFLMHPLIGIWSLGVLVLWPLSGRRACTLAGGGALLLGALMISQLGPFKHFDAEWESVLRSGTHDLFVNVPSEMRWHDHGQQLLLLLLASLHAGRQSGAGRLYLRVAIVAATGLGCSMLASYFWPSQIVIQAQLWRSMWLAAYLVPFAACHLLWRLSEILRPPSFGWPWIFVSLVALFFLLQFALLYVFLVWLALLLLGQSAPGRAYANRLADLLRQVHSLGWLPWLAVLLVLLALPNFWLELSLLEGRVVLPFDFFIPQLAGLLLHGGAGLGAALVAWALHRYGRGPVAPVALLAGIAWSLAHWDMRNERDVAWEARAAFGAQDAMSRLIKPGEVVLWEGRAPMNAWYELRTANYASPVQAIGMVFSREKTFELLNRAQRIRNASAYEQRQQGEVGPAMESDTTFAFSIPKGGGIPLLCQDTGLDWLIVPLPQAPDIGGWSRFPNPYAGENQRTWLYAFRCAHFRT